MAALGTDPDLKKKLLSSIFRPAIVTWNRLEGRPRRVDFDRSLRAEVRDPLWMLCRQWQFGEFIGEDAGSAIKAKVQATTARINRYAARDGRAIGYDDKLPLETLVEREPIQLDLMTRARMGQHWFKLLAEEDLRDDYLARYGFEEPKGSGESEIEARAHLQSNPKAWQTFNALKGRVVDGAQLLAEIRSETKDHEKWLRQLVTDQQKRERILGRAEEFVQWFNRVYSQPADRQDSAWADSYLEYQFACSAPADEQGTKQTVLVAEQYHHGHLDWYSFDINADREAKLHDNEGAQIPHSRLKLEDPISFVPNPVEFEGMPNVRWWEFEDRKVDLGNIGPSTSELATLMLAEFGLIYGNDWSLIPFELEAGSLCEVLGVVITDVFGVRTLIRPATVSADPEREQWSMYRLKTTAKGLDTRLFLPPATAKLQESASLERIILTRDEMANMVWGIEDVIPSLVDGGTNGFEAAGNLERHVLSLAEPESPPGPKAKIRYRLGTRVSENWIPFIPVHLPGSNREIRLQRATMPRLIPGTPDNLKTNHVEPRGQILRAGLDAKPRQPYFIHEEEVPRAGVVVTRTYRRTRWRDGRIYTWLGRRKQTGRGQGSSGLKFDQIAPLE